MSKASTSYDNSNTSLSQLAGLGPTTQRWLQETFKVQTLEDLTDLSVNQVLANPALAQLGAEEKNLCRQKLEQWIQQAQEIVAENQTWQTFATFVVSLQSRQVGEHTQQRTTVYCLESDRRVIWSGIECDGVYNLMLDQLKHTFQLESEVNIPMAPEPRIEPDTVDESLAEPAAATTSEQTESPTTPASTSASPAAMASATPPEAAAEPFAIETDQTVGPDSLSEDSPSATSSASADLADEPTAGAETVATMAEPLSLEITQLQFWQPADPQLPKTAPAVRTGEPGEDRPSTMEPDRDEAETETETETEIAIAVNLAHRSLSETLFSQKPLTLEVTFQITGTAAVKLTQQSHHYQVQCFIQHRLTGERVEVESSTDTSLKPGELTYTHRLPPITLAQSGPYRLQIVTKLDGGHVCPDIVELPFVRMD